MPATSRSPSRSIRVRVLREERGGEPELGAVRKLDRLVLAREGLQGQHGSEDLLLDDLHVLANAGEERRLVVEAAELRRYCGRR